MTPKEMKDVITAFEQGKTIEAIGKEDWREIACPRWDFSNYNYRVKQPELRPHWPAIFQNSLRITNRLFATENEAKDVYPNIIRLATEYPPVMLP